MYLNRRTQTIVILSILYSIQFIYSVYMCMVVRQYYLNKRDGRSDAHSRARDENQVWILQEEDSLDVH